MKETKRWEDMAAELESVMAESKAALARFDAAQDKLKGSIERTRRSTPPVPVQRPVVPALVLPSVRVPEVPPVTLLRPPAKASVG